ncbi:MAG: Ig-like domain-containing protein [Bacteroidales bacterium]|nr:Ig-like domain-containing protein [Bacteroidales bacterium]
MKRILLALNMVLAVMLGHSQSIDAPFFKKVSYIGAFGKEDWTAGWANFDPQNTDYPNPTSILGNGELTLAGGMKITKDTTISGKVKLDGWVYVKSGATLTIQPGTIIRGTTGSTLIIERGAKINAEGTKDQPIVFTSMKPKGSRAPSDWGGVIILGKATNNKGNDVLIEGGVGVQFGSGGSPVEDDNSGVLKYVRIEFPGYDIDGNGNEVNGLTMGSVGSGTTIEYVQVSFSGDDAFEWFGGTVNCRYLIALATEDDDFDTDNGYRGNVQFALAIRDSKICDTDGARGFESDNDANSSYNKPYTSAVFSNVTLIGPGVDESSTKKHDVGLLLRRNTRLQIYNLVATKHIKGGVVIDGDPTQQAAKDDSLIFNNSILAGYGSTAVSRKGTNNPLSNAYDWFLNSSKKNDTTSFSSLKLAFPVNLSQASSSFVPAEGSILLTKGSSWGKAVTSVDISSPKDSILINESIQLTAAVLPNDAANKDVKWSIIEGASHGTISQTGVLQGTSAGNIKVKAEALDGSLVSDSIIIVVKEQVGIKQLTNLSKVYPNPVYSVLNVSGKALRGVEVFDVVGKKVRFANHIASTQVSINMEGLPEGLYVVKVIYQNGSTELHKIFKK